MKRWKAILLSGLTIELALLLGSYASMDPGVEVGLRAEAQANVNCIQAELKGQFRMELETKRLHGELDNANFPLGTAHSFCRPENHSLVCHDPFCGEPYLDQAV